jgi:hypothetical protein
MPTTTPMDYYTARPLAFAYGPANGHQWHTPKKSNFFAFGKDFGIAFAR